MIYYSDFSKYIDQDSGYQFLHSVDSPDHICAFRFVGVMAIERFCKRTITESIVNTQTGESYYHGHLFCGQTSAAYRIVIDPYRFYFSVISAVFLAVYPFWWDCFT